MSALKELPEGWKWGKLGEVAKNKSVKILPSNLQDARFIGMDCIQPHTLRPHKYHNFNEFKSSGNHFKANQILYGRMRPYLNKVCRVDFEGACSGEFIVLDCGTTFNPDLLKYILHSEEFVRFANSITTGDRPRISYEEISNYDIAVPPFEVQASIVAKIEELFSEVDHGVTSLRIAQQQLKSYRQAVLKWAFEGRLTNENVKDGELPEGWKIMPLGGYIKDISSGKSYRCDERPPKTGEVGIIKVSSVTWGFFDEMESKTCFTKDLLNEKYLIKKGDFLFSRANTIEFIGACVIVGKIDKTLMLSDKILRFILTKDIFKEYLLHYLRSRNGRRQIEILSTGNQNSMRNIGQEKIKQIEIPYCALKEQQNIIENIERRFSVADKMDESITQSLQRSEALRQSILKRAFEGNL